MKTVHEVSALSGVSIRTLQYYDEIGLLPARRTEAGYRLYDGKALERLQQILLFRSLEFPLKEIREIMSSPSFDRQQALEDQIRLLELKRQHLDNLIALAREIKAGGEKEMSFQAFDTKDMDQYKQEAKARWGNTKAYQEFEKKDKNRTDGDRQALGEGMMDIFRRLGQIRQGDPAGTEAQGLIQELQEYITAHFYPCTGQILLSLGQMYASGGDMTRNIDSAGGEGTGDFARRAIEAFVKQ